MRFDFSVLLFHPDLGEDTISVVIYAKSTANAWNKLYYQLTKAKLMEHLISVCLLPEGYKSFDELFDALYVNSNAPYADISGDEK